MYLGTHNIQNVSVFAINAKPGKALIGCNFVSGSESTGYLAIITDISSASSVQYRVAERRQDFQTDIVSNLTSGEHRALVFSMKSNGIPQAAPANLPRNITIEIGALTVYNSKQEKLQYYAYTCTRLTVIKSMKTNGAV